tara:strand:- start:491 stop:1003 length:513 start_codon:yes stop_codon:yes gene_type:complete
MRIISNCPLCEEHSLHVVGENELKTQQCINCGYVTAEKFSIVDMKKEDNKSYQELTDDMKSWSKTAMDKIWIPSIITLPIGMLYPFDEDNKMKWALAPMVTLSEEEQKEYPKPDGNGYYDKKIDTDNPEVFEDFLHGMALVNEKMRNLSEQPEQSQKPVDIKLPKLKKIK